MINLIHGDAIEEMKKIESGTIDFIFADPPYETTKCKCDVMIPVGPMWEQINRIKKERSAVLLFAQSPFDKILGASNLKQLKYEWIWEKPNGTGFLNAKKMPIKAHENILVFYDKLPVYNYQKTTGHKRKTAGKKPVLSEHYGKAIRKTNYDSTERYPRSVLKFSSEKQINKGLHPFLKPLALIEYFIKTYSNPGDHILDFSMGSGTTGLGCKNLGRHFTGIDDDIKSFETAKKRML